VPHQRLPDCRPPQRDDSITSASSHPELLTGDIARRPRIHISLQSRDHDVASTWNRRLLALSALLAAAIMGHSMINPSTTTVAQDASKEGRALAETCPQRNAAAADAAAGNVHGHVITQETTMACQPATDQTNAGQAPTRQPQQD
jgi:hypothetical protein